MSGKTWKNLLIRQDMCFIPLLALILLLAPIIPNGDLFLPLEAIAARVSLSLGEMCLGREASVPSGAEGYAEAGLGTERGTSLLVRGIEGGDFCDPLPLTGNVINVNPSQASTLDDIVQNASTGDTILLADGTYALHGDYLWFGTPGVTLRSASGNREAVTIDGGYETTEIVTVAASDVTIADVTLMRARTHPIHVVGADDADTLRTMIYNVHIIDPGQQAIKINQNRAMTHFPDNGVVACSHIELTDAGRPYIWDINGSCYTGGVDGHQARGWVIRDNRIEGFWCEEDISEHGIHFWSGSRDTVVERNVLVDNARGVGFGLGASGAGRTYDDNPYPEADYVGHYDGIIRNNFIFASRDALFASEVGFDCGICLEQACIPRVLHNSVVSTQAPFSSIEWRWPDTDAEIANNLVSHNLREREKAVAALAGNLTDAPLSLFVDGAGGNLHLTAEASAAIDAGVTVPAGACDEDIDGDARPAGTAPDIGADEYSDVPSPPAAVKDLRVTSAITHSGSLTATLRWTPATDALSVTLRYASTRITAANWSAASLLADELPGDTEQFVAMLPYAGGTVYFALTSQNAAGGTSDISNNAFWPWFEGYLPLILAKVK